MILEKRTNMLQHFHYWLTGHGSAEVFFTGDAERLRFDFINFNDPLDQLIAALVELVAGNIQSAEVLFADDQDGYMLAIHNLPGSVATIEIRYSVAYGAYREGGDNRDEYQVQFRESDLLVRLASVVISGALELQARHLNEDYLAEWGR
ncbi:MAG: hypothetical protein EOP06_05055, partial [Proteobacteria bacterium]